MKAGVLLFDIVVLILIIFQVGTENGITTYHTMISVSWIDLTFIEEVYVARLLPSKVINHREELENKLRDIRFDYVVGEKTIRVFGYAPRVREYFES